MGFGGSVFRGLQSAGQSIAGGIKQQQETLNRAKATQSFLKAFGDDLGIDPAQLENASVQELNQFSQFIQPAIQLQQLRGAQEQRQSQIGIQTLRAKTAGIQAKTAAAKAGLEVEKVNKANIRVGQQEDLAIKAAQMASGAIPVEPGFESFAQDQNLVNVGNVLLQQGKGSVDAKTLSDAITPEVKNELEVQIQETQLAKAQLDLQESQGKIAGKVDIKPTELRKEFNGLGQIKDLRKVQAAFGKVNRAGTGKQTPASDLALVFNFMKILDPSSVVRESEFRSAASARGALERAEGAGEFVPAFVTAAVNRAFEGLLLLPKQRKDFVNQAGQAFEGQVDAARPAISQFLDLEELRGFQPGIVVPKEDRELIEGIEAAVVPPVVTEPAAPQTLGELKAGDTITLPTSTGESLTGEVIERGGQFFIKTDQGEFPLTEQ